MFGCEWGGGGGGGSSWACHAEVMFYISGMLTVLSEIVL